MYKKIDIYVDGIYVCSTNWSKTLKQAKENYLAKYNTTSKVVCVFA